MPRLIEMATLVERCKQRSDKENDSHISDAEWQTLISEQFGELHGVVAETGMRYWESTFSITATGATSYTEPDDHLSTIAVRYVVSSTTGERRDLEEIMVQESSSWSGRTGEAYAFAHVDDQIYLYPKPSSGSYEMIYVPQPADLADYDDTDVVDVVTADGEAFMLWGVSVKALAKSQHDVTLAIRERDAARERLREWAVLKAINAPRRRPDPYAVGDLEPGGWWSR